MLWSRKPASTHERSRQVGVDLTASRMVAVSIGSGKVRRLAFEGQQEELTQFIAFDRRSPEIGRSGYSQYRKVPHTVCTNFLPSLGQSREWRAGRYTITPESALELSLQKLREAVAAEGEAVVLSLPSYLTPAQITRVVKCAGRCKLPLNGTVIGPLALAAMRLGGGLAAGKAIEEPARAGVIPLRPAGDGTGNVVVVDVDEFALSAAILSVEKDVLRVVNSSSWPRLSMKAWKDRLLDAVADRCVRLCRRDPRDSADAEQALFEQLDEGLERIRTGQRISLTVRTDHWFQDVIQQPEEFEAHCGQLARSASEVIRGFVDDACLAAPPREVWLTYEAGRLPGLSRSIQMDSHEGTLIQSLSSDAGALGAASLVPRWLSSELPRAHLDSQLPQASRKAELPGEMPRTGKR